MCLHTITKKHPPNTKVKYGYKVFRLKKINFKPFQFPPQPQDMFEKPDPKKPVRNLFQNLQKDMYIGQTYKISEEAPWRQKTRIRTLLRVGSLINPGKKKNQWDDIYCCGYHVFENLQDARACAESMVGRVIVKVRCKNIRVEGTQSDYMWKKGRSNYHPPKVFVCKEYTMLKFVE